MEKSGNSDRFCFGGLQNHWGQWLQPWNKKTLGRKAMTNLDNILKSKGITLPTKVWIVKATLLPVVMYRSKSWTINKAECQGIDPFELWCWRRLVKIFDSKEIKLVKLVNRKGNQSWIFIGRTDAEAGIPIPWPPERRADSLEKPWCWKRLMAFLLFSAIFKASSKTILSFCISLS